MAKRISDEERVLEFFSEAEFGKAEIVFNLSKSVMRKRAVKEGKATVKARAGGKRKEKSEPAPPESGGRSDMHRQQSDLLKGSDGAERAATSSSGLARDRSVI